MIKNFSEEQLVLSLKAGDEAAIAEIYRRYWRKLLAIAYNHFRDKSSAEEIVQDVLIKLWDRRAEVSIDSLSGYLVTAVKYTILNAIYRERRRNEIAFNVFGSNDCDFDDEKIYANFLKEYINGVVEKLPEKCRLVFKCSREQGKNIPQIAFELNIAEKTVEAHLTKALKSIKLSLRNTSLVLLVSFVYLIS
ncbi:RNA polymerase sigma-70 factor [Mucilaginibacter sp. KACC 22773]|uniref:RNA polymerase sigma-70 factor n=1 Tax=Mucilaginibacter sp. KACC 22773 TaxID=3025671 RepID=UPI002366EBF9|nr:RNA polymerase sigma-70 factor [Mucilaginibacter sp. KACC 22773]WDF77197.1 RNA polymerase sigma-70 factor [Mucilaginibacter sp. KACC 22773]